MSDTKAALSGESGFVQVSRGTGGDELGDGSRSQVTEGPMWQGDTLQEGESSRQITCSGRSILTIPGQRLARVY